MDYIVAMILQAFRSKIIIINPKLGSAIVDSKELTVNQTDKFIVDRKYIFLGNSSSSKAIEWKLSYEYNGQRSKLIEYTSLSRNDFSVDQIAVELSKLLKIPLIDLTGIDEHKILPNQWISIAERLEANPTKVEASSLPRSVQTSYDTDHYVLEIDPSWKMNDYILLSFALFVVAILVVMIVTLFGIFDNQNLTAQNKLQSIVELVIGMLFLILIALYCINLINPKIIVEISSETVRINKKGKFRTMISQQLDLSRIYFINLMKTWKYYEIEFVGDHQRYNIFGEYTLDEAIALKTSIETAIIDLS